MELGAMRQLSHESKGNSLVGEEGWRRVEIYGDVEYWNREFCQGSGKEQKL